MALGAEQQASAWSTIDAQDSIRLLRIMIAISYQVAFVLNPTLSDQSSRRWRCKKTSLQHNFSLQNGQEKQRKRQHIPYTKERSPHGYIRSGCRFLF